MGDVAAAAGFRRFLQWHEGQAAYRRQSAPSETAFGRRLTELGFDCAWESPKKEAKLRPLSVMEPGAEQVHLSLSEIGVECDRQLAGIPATNHVIDPWPSIRGTALHTWAAPSALALVVTARSTARMRLSPAERASRRAARRS